jgi:ATP-dependent exoDNAse (exonuclease V) beta subunit
MKPADQAQRDAAIAERARNVLIDAGAGTGKTTLLADRLVELVAPEKSGGSAVPIGRIAAITFTRKAAGELKLRVRERLLSGLARSSGPRAAQLRDALAGLDTAYISTIHSFCDRLLRLRPVEARLSPSYDIAEDASALEHEAFHLLLEAAQSQRLDAELAGTPAAGLAREAQETVIDALSVGLRRDTQEGEFWSYFGLDALARSFIQQRDVSPTLPPAPRFSAKPFHVAREEFLQRAKDLGGDTLGARWIGRLGAVLRRLEGEDDPVPLWAALGKLVRGPGGKSSGVQKKVHFADEESAWGLWKIYEAGSFKKEKRGSSLRDDLVQPLHRWMARRLVRLRPVVLALYDKVKARRRQLDQIDLLLCLRNLLAKDLATRGFYQSLFDHVFIDEFQDTDPLQAEVALYLCEARPVATDWTQVELAPGRLTLVGDPKQSIYRFRRADIAVYDQVRAHVARGSCLSVTLSTNFRSTAPLIDFVNDRFARIFGPAKPGEALFDATTGTVRHQDLGPAPDAAPDAAPGAACVRALPIHAFEGAKTDDFRKQEAEALARYLRHLVDSGTTHIVDSLDGQRRPLRFGDIAVLTISTWNLKLLFPALDAFGIPHAVRGGRMLLEDPLHRQFLLALRAIADRDDGPAQAALMRPPFFAVDLIDLLHERAARAEPPLAGELDAERAARAREALELIHELRRERLSRPVGATARDLLERTAFGRMIATGPNGEQRLERVRQICRALEQLAADEGLDYDGATELARAWVDDPIPLDPPAPAGDEAMQVLTVHQAKGLEFPIVVLWDGMAAWQSPPQSGAFGVSRDGTEWALQLDGLDWSEPESADLGRREAVFRTAERRRVIYVAATRARDLLLIPAPTLATPGRHVSADLLAEAGNNLVETIEPYGGDSEPAWAAGVEPAPEVAVAPPKARALAQARAAEEALAASWTALAAASAQPHLAPISVTALAHEAPAVVRASEDDDAVEPAPRPTRTGRFGRFGKVFGDAVHRAIGIKLNQPSLSTTEAVARAARIAGFSDHFAEAAADVDRTISALQDAGLTSGEWRLEYPIGGTHGNGHLVQGFLDLLATGANGELVIIEFKTDSSPSGDVTINYPAYVTQVLEYRDLMYDAGVRGDAPTKCALLFTGDGQLRWCGQRP